MNIPLIVGGLALSVLITLIFIHMGKTMGFINKIADILGYHHKRLDLYDLRLKNLQNEISSLKQTIDCLADELKEARENKGK
jgi:peptidoglycan hydrolase CwlO-like protein